MKYRHVLAGVVAAAIASVAPTAQARPALDPKGGVLVNTWSSVSGPHGEVFWPDAWFMYEAAMSGRFGPIETVASVVFGEERVEVVRRWERVDDFATCAETPNVGYNLLSREPVILLAPRSGDLVQGRCVVGRLIPAVTARYAADYAPDHKGLLLRDRASRRIEAEARGTYWHGATIWSLFGVPALKARYVEPDPDIVADGDLVDAFARPRRIRDAALDLLDRRLVLDVYRTTRPSVREQRSTSREVGAALAASGLLESDDEDLRTRSMLAAAAAPAAADLLLPRIRAGLAAHVDDSDQVRVRQRIAAHPETASDPRWQARLNVRHPGAEYPNIASAAAFAAARFGPDVLAALWPEVEAGTVGAFNDGYRANDDIARIVLSSLCDAAPERLAALPAVYPKLAGVRAAADACPATG